MSTCTFRRRSYFAALSPEANGPFEVGLVVGRGCSASLSRWT